MPKAKLPEPPVTRRVLYVVLHGLISLVSVKKKGLIAHLLDIGDEHKYLVGEWLGEKDIPERKRGRDPLRATLQGVKTKGNTAQMDAGLNAILKLKSVPSDVCADVRAVIRLPRPYAIYSFVSGKLPPDALKGDTSILVKKPTFLSGTQVFEYNVRDKKKLALKKDGRGKLWQAKAPARVPVGKPAKETWLVWVLHIYDEPGVTLANAKEHNRLEFRLSSTLFNSDLDLAKPTDDPAPETNVPPGLIRAELQNLDLREKLVLPIVISIRQGDIVAVGGGGGAGGPTCGGNHGQTG